MNTKCDDVRSLLPSYLDGELSEVQAKPVRGHLLDCQACRESVQEGKVVRRWFAAAEEPVEIPDGFAARVARRAFAGDPGVLTPRGATPPLIVERAASAAFAGDSKREVLAFVVPLTAVAAAVLFVLSLFIKNADLPTGSDVGADDIPYWMKPGWEQVDERRPRADVPVVAPEAASVEDAKAKAKAEAESRVDDSE